MKAGILREYGTLPVFDEAADVVVEPLGAAVLGYPLASSIKQLDRAKAAGRHYTKFAEMPAVMGMDGVARLGDGSLVFGQALGGNGMMAERALLDEKSLVVLPAGIDLALAASLPNALMGSDMALLRRGQIKPGDVVLVNGATGRTGALAVQMAKYRGAARVIATGRNPHALAKLRELGADVTISLAQDDEAVVRELVSAYKEAPFDIVLDYLWGKPSELVLAALAQVKFMRQVKFVTIGNMAASTISLASQVLRSRDLVLLGSGIGASSGEEISRYFAGNLPEIFAFAASGKLTLPVHEFSLQQISEAWDTPQAVVMIRENE